MAKIVCENGDYLEFYNFKKWPKYDEYSLTHSFSVYVKSGTFSGTGNISTFKHGLTRWYNELVEMCSKYSGEATIWDADYDYEIATSVKIEYKSLGHFKISGILIEDWQDGQKLFFHTSAAVSSFDTFLPALKREIEKVKG